MGGGIYLDLKVRRLCRGLHERRLPKRRPPVTGCALVVLDTKASPVGRDGFSWVSPTKGRCVLVRLERSDSIHHLPWWADGVGGEEVN